MQTEIDIDTTRIIDKAKTSSQKFTFIIVDVNIR